jgi:hypothetical protein
MYLFRGLPLTFYLNSAFILIENGGGLRKRHGLGTLENLEREPAKLIITIYVSMLRALT